MRTIINLIKRIFGIKESKFQPGEIDLDFVRKNDEMWGGKYSN